MGGLRSYGIVLCLALQCSQLVLADTAIFCVHNEDERHECRRFRSIPPLNVDCTNHKAGQCLEFSCEIAEDCRVEVRERRANVMMASALGLWYLQQDFSGQYTPVAAENRPPRGDDVRVEGLSYKAVAIATQAKCDALASRAEGPLTLKTSAALRSCHGEYGDLAGWVAPIATLKEMGLSEGGSDIDLVTNWFSKSCAPSNSDEGLCTACSQASECDLDDLYASPMGVAQCLRDDAADIGFVDHWSAWTAKRQQGNASTSDLRVVCDDGCRGLEFADEANCYLAKIPADVAIMREDDPLLVRVRSHMVKASESARFRASFGPSSNLNGALFSHGTTKLDLVIQSAQDYLQALDGTLTQFSELFKASTDIPQPDAENVLVREVQRHPGRAVAITFLAALVVGVVSGLGLTTLLCRRRMRAMRHNAQQLEKELTEPRAPVVSSGQGAANRPTDDGTYVDES